MPRGVHARVEHVLDDEFFIGGGETESDYWGFNAKLGLDEVSLYSIDNVNGEIELVTVPSPLEHDFNYQMLFIYDPDTQAVSLIVYGAVEPVVDRLFLGGLRKELLPFLATASVHADAHHGHALFDITTLPVYLRVIVELLAIGFIYVLGKYGSRPIFRAIAAARVREVFVAAALALRELELRHVLRDALAQLSMRR